MKMTNPSEIDLSAQLLMERIRDHGGEIQLFMNSVLVSVAVANAAYVFALCSAAPFRDFYGCHSFSRASAWFWLHQRARRVDQAESRIHGLDGG